MKLPQFLEGLRLFLQNLPPTAYLLAIPLIAFLAAIGVTFAVSNDDPDTPALVPTVGPSLANLDVPATATPSATAARPTPTATVAVLNREDCAQIDGTEYLSVEEREWYLANCLGGSQQVASADNGSSGGASGDSSSGDSSSGGGGSVNSPSGANTVGASEYGLGDRMVIPRIGIDAAVNGIQVPTNGAMPNPVGYFNFLWYDFSSFGGLGGYAGSGNHVVGCHVDSAVYGLALCWHARDLVSGDQIQYYKSNGEVLNYVVTSAATYPATSDFSGIVSSGTADLTIITCTGTFASGSYDQRHVVQASLQ